MNLIYLNKINLILKKKLFYSKNLKKNKRVSILYYSCKKGGLRLYSFTGFFVNFNKNGLLTSLDLYSKIDNFYLKKHFFIFSPYIIGLKFK